MGPRRALTEAEIRERPHSKWNAFVDILATSEPDQLDARQRPAHLVFWYDSEVQNGGHFQYFENRGLDDVPETIKALRRLGAERQADILSQALQLASGHDWGVISATEQFVAEAVESDVAQFDAPYYACAPSVQVVLEKHLHEHQDWYLDVSAA